jgi:hypothetical protein
MKRINTVWLCLVAMFAVSGIGAGSAFAYPATHRQACAESVEGIEEHEVQKRHLEGLPEFEGYFTTLEECEKQFPILTIKGMNEHESIGPWINVERYKGPPGWENCRHVARPELGKPGEPGPYSDEKCTKWHLEIWEPRGNTQPQRGKPEPYCRGLEPEKEEECAWALVYPPAYFAICVESKGTGQYENPVKGKDCTKENPKEPQKGNYNLVSYNEVNAGQREEFKFTDKTKGAVTVGAKTCKKSKSTGEAISNTETTDTITYEKCKEGAKKVPNFTVGPFISQLLPGGVIEADGQQYAITPINVMGNKSDVALGGGAVNQITWASKVEIINE